MVRRRSDPGYRRIWLGDWRRVLVENLAAASERVDLVVVTAPGSTFLPFDRSQCTHPSGETCSGLKGCVVDPTALDEWNSTAPARWTALHRAASAATRRRHGRFSIVARAWEPQRRGALHQNVVLSVGTAPEMAAAATYRRELAQRARSYGFGFVDRKRGVRTALHAARYLAKYLSEGTGKMGIGDLAARGDCPVVIVRVNRELTCQTGQTIRACRRRRGTWHLASVLATLDPARGCSVAEAEAIRIKVSRSRGHREAWSSSTTSGRSSLPWDVQAALASWERTAAEVAEAWRGWSPAPERSAEQLRLN